MVKWVSVRQVDVKCSVQTFANSAFVAVYAAFVCGPRTTAAHTRQATTRTRGVSSVAHNRAAYDIGP
jgi:hypothetical protein